MSPCNPFLFQSFNHEASLFHAKKSLLGDSFFVSPLNIYALFLLQLMCIHLPLKVTQVVSDRLSWKSVFLQEDCVSESDYKMTRIKMNDEGRLLE